MLLHLLHSGRSSHRRGILRHLPSQVASSPLFQWTSRLSLPGRYGTADSDVLLEGQTGVRQQREEEWKAKGPVEATAFAAKQFQDIVTGRAPDNRTIGSVGSREHGHRQRKLSSLTLAEVDGAVKESLTMTRQLFGKFQEEASLQVRGIAVCILVRRLSHGLVRCGNGSVFAGVDNG